MRIEKFINVTEDLAQKLLDCLVMTLPCKIRLGSLEGAEHVPVLANCGRSHTEIQCGAVDFFAKPGATECIEST